MIARASSGSSAWGGAAAAARAAARPRDSAARQERNGTIVSLTAGAASPRAAPPRRRSAPGGARGRRGSPTGGSGSAAPRRAPPPRGRGAGRSARSAGRPCAPRDRGRRTARRPTARTSAAAPGGWRGGRALGGRRRGAGGGPDGVRTTRGAVPAQLAAGGDDGEHQGEVRGAQEEFGAPVLLRLLVLRARRTAARGQKGDARPWCCNHLGALPASGDDGGAGAAGLAQRLGHLGGAVEARRRVGESGASQYLEQRVTAAARRAAAPLENAREG